MLIFRGVGRRSLSWVTFPESNIVRTWNWMVFCILTREISKRTDPLKKKKRSPEKNPRVYEKIALVVTYLTGSPLGFGRNSFDLWIIYPIHRLEFVVGFRRRNTLDFFLQNWSQRLIGGFGSIILPFQRGDTLFRFPCWFSRVFSEVLVETIRTN